jgi:predicted HicB family RNase H-like nuclease
MSTKHISLRLPPEVHSRLVAAAEQNHRSLNGEIEHAIDLHLQREALRGQVVRHPGDPRGNDLDNLELREQS